MTEKDLRYYQEKLFQLTLKYVTKYIPYYEKAYNHIDINSMKLSDMNRLPLITKDDVRENPQQFLCRGETPYHILWTGGTTSEALPVYFSQEELVPQKEENESKKEKRLGVLVCNTDHGLPPKSHTSAFWLERFLDFNIYSHNIDKIIKDLTTSHSIYGVEDTVSLLMFTSVEHVKAVVSEVAQRGLQLTLKAVFGTGDYITPRWRAYCERVFGAPYIECYANTETMGVASRCTACGWYHFSYHVIPEVVDIDTLEPIQEGRGYLVLTNLYPFRQMQLLIRYNTEDIVDIKHCAESPLAFEMRGRKQETLTTEKGLIFMRDVLDILDDIPDIYTIEPYYYKPFKLNYTGKTLNMWTVLYYDPNLYPERVKKVKETIQKEFSKVYPFADALTIYFIPVDEKIFTWPPNALSTAAEQVIVSKRRAPTHQKEEGTSISSHPLF
jgi:phenylacetate-CoA ligase